MPARWWDTFRSPHGVHGIAIANDLNNGFITNGQSNSVTIFDLKTLAKFGEPAAGKNPDAVCYEPKTKRVFAINHTGNDATAIDAKTGEVLKTFPLGAAAEFCQTDGAGKLYVNLEGFDRAAGDRRGQDGSDAPPVARAVRRSVSGLAIDVKGKKLFSVCDNKMMAVIDIPTLEVIATPADRARSGRGGLRFQLGAGVQLERRWHADHRQAGERQVRCRGHRDHRARRAHHDGRREDAQDLPAGRRIWSGAGAQGRPEEGPAPVLPDSFHVLVVGK